MSYSDPSETPQSRVSAALLMGAASPLWGYFGAAAAGGLAFWWMTRWTRPVNLEALLDAAGGAPAPVMISEPGAETVDVAAAAAADAVVAEASEVAAEAASEPPVEPAPQPILEAASEPVVRLKVKRASSAADSEPEG